MFNLEVEALERLCEEEFQGNLRFRLTEDKVCECDFGYGPEGPYPKCELARVCRPGEDHRHDECVKLMNIHDI